MTRLLVHVEGETEETFVNEVLRDHLTAFGYMSVSARLMGNARQRLRRGGIRGWNTVKRDIVRHLHEDEGRVVTIIVDYYGLPATGEHGWPGRAQAAQLASASEKGQTVEMALRADIAGGLNEGAAERFVPFVIMHEFEGLLFSDCADFADSVGRNDLEDAFQNIREQFDSPEEINDSPITAPSKRVMALMPNYEKPLFGNLAILQIGLQKIRDVCPLFHGWLTHLETRT